MFSFKNIGSYKSTNLAVSETDKQDIEWESFNIDNDKFENNWIEINQILCIYIFFVFYFEEVLSKENKIIFKINDIAYTSLDYEMRVRYLDFVGSNNNLKK